MALAAVRQIQFYVNGTARAGRRLQGNLTIVASRECQVQALRVFLEARVQYVSDFGIRRTEVVRRQAREHRRESLPAGTTTLGVVFELDRDHPATVSDGHCVVQTIVTVEIDRPWWFDRYATFEIDVAPATTARVGERVVDTVLTHGAGAPFDVALAHTLVPIRGAVRGAVAAHGVGPQVPRFEVRLRQRVHVDVAAIENGKQRPRATYEGREARVEVRPAGPRGSPTAFRLDVPAGFVPTHDSLFVSVDHELTIRSTMSSESFRVPIVLDDDPDLARKASRRRVPVVGNARSVDLLSRAARRAGLAFEDGQLVGTLVERPARVVWEIDASGRAWAELTVEIEPLGLGVEIISRAVAGLSHRPSSRSARTMEVTPKFDGLYFTHVESVLQAERFVRAFELGVDTQVFVALDDDSIRFRAEAFDDPKEIIKLVEAVRASLRRVLPHTASVAAPPSIAVNVAQFETLAAGMDGRAVLGDLSIRDAVVNGHRVALTTSFAMDRDGLVSHRVEVTFASEIEFDRLVIEDLSAPTSGLKGRHAELASGFAERHIAGRLAVDGRGAVAEVDAPHANELDVRLLDAVVHLLVSIPLLTDTVRAPFR